MTVTFFLSILGVMVRYAITLVQYTRGTYDDVIGFTLIEMAIVAIVSGVVIFFGWWKSERIARLLVGELKDEPLVISTSNKDLLRLILSVLGLYLFATTIADLGGLAVYQVQTSQSSSQPGFGFADESALVEMRHLVTTLISLAISVILMVGAGRVGLLFHQPLEIRLDKQTGKRRGIRALETSCPVT
jgi:hypothetical protein